MWSTGLLLLLVGAAVAEHYHGWETGKEYQYQIRSRTMAMWKTQADQNSGILMKGTLKIQPKDQDTLQAEIFRAQYSYVHTVWSEGWNSDVPDHMLQFQNMPLSNKPFEIKMKHGVVRDLVVDRSVPTWEVNILKSVVSQLQVDTQGENAMKSKGTQVPEDDHPYAMFHAMEDTVGGMCEVTYDITPLPEEVLQREPELVPLPELRENGQHIDIIKTKNYTKCQQRMGYHFGITGKTNWEPGSNDNGRLLSKTSTSRIVISGKLNRFTIQSSVTTNTILSIPGLDEDRVGMVIAKMNLTLASMEDVKKSLGFPSDPESTGNLVYTYNDPFSKSMYRKPGRPRVSYASKPDSSSASSMSSSEESKRFDKEDPRNPRGPKNPGSSSSSDSASSSSISSSEEGDFWQAKPQLNEAPDNPLLPFFIGYKGKAIGMSHEVDPVESAKDLVQQIAKELDEPSDIPSKNTLEKFDILTDLVRTMNVQQMSQVEGNIASEDETQRQNGWSAFRDAVAQAGTGPALITIKNWIMNKKIDNVEAGHIMMNMPVSARTPTAEYIAEVFSIATNPEVQKQNFLNSTAILAFTDLVRNAQISNGSVHNHYPVHSFGRMVSKHDQAVLREYIPYLSARLNEAIRHRDSPKAQVYIVALGNIGHPKILSEFEPYLEGKVPVTTYQRTLIVSSMNKLAELYPKLARSVFYKIYLNTLEAHEVRCMAVYLMMLTNPPLTMLQRMADFTNYDHSRHVNSAVKSSIQSAAQLKRKESQILARNARLAQRLLNPREYSYQYSHASVYDMEFKNSNSGNRLTMSYIGSEDSIIPRALYLGMNSYYDGFEIPTVETAAMLSSVKDILTFADKNEKERDSFSLSDKIAQVLRAEPNVAEPFEGSIYHKSLYGKLFVPFDKQSLKKTAKRLLQSVSTLKDERRVNFNKFASYDVTISFPTETGLPFVFTNKFPMLVKVAGKGKVDLKPGFTVDANAEFRALYSMKANSRMGFVTPFDHQHFMAGLDRSLQIYAPVKIQLKVNPDKKEFQLKLRPNSEEKKGHILHKSTIPYTTRQNLLDLRPVALDKNTQIVTDNQPQYFDWDYPSKNSRTFKFAAELDGENAKDFVHWIQNPHQGILALPSIFNSKYRKLNMFVNTQLGDEEPIVLSGAFDTKTQQHSERSRQEGPDVPVVNDKEPNSEPRRRKFLDDVGQGMKSPTSNVLDLDVKIPGLDNVITLAWSKSNADEKSRVLAYWKVENPDGFASEVCAGGKIKSNPISTLNYEKAAKAEPRSDFKMEVQYGRRCEDGDRVTIEGEQKQTEQFKEKVRKFPIIKKCQEEMRRGNKGLRACQKAAILIATPDETKLSVQSNSEWFKAAATMGINILKDAASPHFIVNSLGKRNHKQEKLNVILQLQPNFEKADLTMYTDESDVTFDNIRLDSEVISELMLSGMNNPMDPTALSDDETCVLDNNQATTFDDRTFPLRLGKCSYVAMITIPKKISGRYNQLETDIPEDKKVSILVEELEDGQKKVKIQLGENDVHLSPGNGNELEASVNRKHLKLSRRENHRQLEHGEAVFEIFALPDGTAKLESEKYGIEAVYDGQRVQIKAADKYRNSIRGLCGNYDTEPDNDFTSPGNCMLAKSEEFTASYALTNEHCDAETVQEARNIQEAQQLSCRRQSHRLSNVISDKESGRSSQKENKRWGYHKNENEDRNHQQCNTHRTKVVTYGNQICFTMRPIPACKNQCTPTETRQKEFPLYCVSRDNNALEMQQRVERGANPDFSQKPQSRTARFEVPLGCAPYSA